MPLEVNRAGPSRRIPTHPLSQLEEDLAVWCNRHGQSDTRTLVSEAGLVADRQRYPSNPCFSRMNLAWLDYQLLHFPHPR